MKTVKIVGGGYGCRKPGGGTKLVVTGQTVEVDDAEAKRLCTLGVAEEVDGAPQETAAPETTAATEAEPKQTRRKPMRK